MRVFETGALHEESLQEIVSLLQRGGVIAYPTDTAYGLGVDPFDAAAVARIFRLKGRPETKPILLLVDSLDMAAAAIQVTATFDRIARNFWPGPLTIITRAAQTLPENVTAGTRTVGLRWPQAEFALRLLRRFGKPLTATSANKSGLPSAVTAQEVRDQFGEAPDALIDGGTLPSRTGSTLLDITVDPPAVLREGPIAFETLAGFFNGNVRRSFS